MGIGEWSNYIPDLGSKSPKKRGKKNLLPDLGPGAIVLDAAEERELRKPCYLAENPSKKMRAEREREKLSREGPVSISRRRIVDLVPTDPLEGWKSSTPEDMEEPVSPAAVVSRLKLGGEALDRLLTRSRAPAAVERLMGGGSGRAGGHGGVAGPGGRGVSSTVSRGKDTSWSEQPTPADDLYSRFLDDVSVPTERELKLPSIGDHPPPGGRDRSATTGLSSLGGGTGTKSRSSPQGAKKSRTKSEGAAETPASEEDQYSDDFDEDEEDEYSRGRSRSPAGGKSPAFTSPGGKSPHSPGKALRDSSPGATSPGSSPIADRYRVYTNKSPTGIKPAP